MPSVRCAVMHLLQQYKAILLAALAVGCVGVRHHLCDMAHRHLCLALVTLYVELTLPLPVQLHGPRTCAAMSMAFVWVCRCMRMNGKRL